MRTEEDDEFERIEREMRHRQHAEEISQQAEKVMVLTHYYMKFCPSCRSLFHDLEEAND
jgi:hypothetical protein